MFGEALWSMSNTELHAQFRGAAQRMDGWYELAMFMAWHTALWTRAKTLPTWESIKQKLKPAQQATATGKQDWREVRANMAALRAAQKDAPTGKPRPKMRRK